MFVWERRAQTVTGMPCSDACLNAPVATLWVNDCTVCQVLLLYAAGPTMTGMLWGEDGMGATPLVQVRQNDSVPHTKIA
jgi:hypothetical protein